MSPDFNRSAVAASISFSLASLAFFHSLHSHFFTRFPFFESSHFIKPPPQASSWTSSTTPGPAVSSTTTFAWISPGNKPLICYDLSLVQNWVDGYLMHSTAFSLLVFDCVILFVLVCLPYFDLFELFVWVFLHQDTSDFIASFDFQLSSLLWNRRYPSPSRDLHCPQIRDGGCGSGLPLLSQPWCSNPGAFTLLGHSLSCEYLFLLLSFCSIFIQPIFWLLLCLRSCCPGKSSQRSVIIYRGFLWRICPSSTSSTCWGRPTKSSSSAQDGCIELTHHYMCQILASLFSLLSLPISETKFLSRHHLVFTDVNSVFSSNKWTILSNKSLYNLSGF